jgi:PAS domain S-box-containing protein
MDEKTIPNAPSLINKSQTATSKTDSGIPAWGNDFHYRALFEQSDDCIFIISFGLVYMAANPQALQLLGYSEEELIGKPVSEIMALDESLGHEAVLENSSSLFERVLKCKDGTTVPVEISTSIIYNETGQPAYIQSIARDISRRKEVERSLRRRDQIMISISDATTRLLQSTKFEENIAEILGSLGQATGAVSCFIVKVILLPGHLPIQILFEWQKDNSNRIEIENSLTPCMEFLLNSSEGIFAENVDIPQARSAAIVRILGKTGSREFLGLFYPENVDTWLPSQRDVVQVAANIIGAALQRDQHEEAILESEARNRTIIEALPDLIIRLDDKGKILDYNAKPDHPLYHTQYEVAGKLLSEIWPREIASQIMGRKTGEAFTKPHHLKEFKLPFSPQTYESRLAPIASHEALLVVRDITEQAKLNEMKSDFINRASHELRMPLTNTILMANLIQEGGTQEEIQEYWNILNSELNRQKILIERLLMAGRLESRALKLEIVPIDLTAILEESILAVKMIANKKNISIRVSGPAKPVVVMGDRSGLQHVFINLINNAIKFSPEASFVGVDVTLSKKEARIAISDHGMGIPPEDLPHLYERFFRGRNVTIAEIPGSGIGLYIVKSIVEELGGRIEVESVLKEGTTFTVALKRSLAHSTAG